MRLLVCGDREWTDRETIERTYQRLFDGPETLDLLIHGGCRGADTLAWEGVLGWGGAIPVRIFHADWETHGKAAGPIRNQRMIDEGEPDLVVAFHSKLAESRGTMDLIRRANRAGIEVRIIPGKR